MKKTLSLIAMMAAMSTPALAELAPMSADAAAAPVTVSGPNDKFGLNLGVSTLGATVEATFKVNDKFGFRLPYGEASASYEEESNGETYSGDLNLGGFGLLADYRPTGKNFRVSGGAFATDYSASALAQNVNGSGSNIQVDIYQKERIAPMLGLGYDAKIFKGKGRFSVDAGAIFGKGFNVDARDTSGTMTQSDVDNETAELRDAAGKMKVLPYVKVSVGFVF
jgi:hypothetical protein